jgi:hypothetical protein
MSRITDQYEAENYHLSFRWDYGVLEIVKTWRSSGYISVTKLTKSETLALGSFIEGNLESKDEVSSIDDWVQLV